MTTQELAESKICNTCGETKPITEFNLNGNRLRYECKECKRKRDKKYRLTHKTKHILECRRFRENNRDRLRATQKIRNAGKDRNGTGEKALARQKLRTAVASGKIMKPDHCEMCLKPKQPGELHGHHNDYSKPLEVMWLCSVCHGLMHRKEII